MSDLYVDILKPSGITRFLLVACLLIVFPKITFILCRFNEETMLFYAWNNRTYLSAYVEDENSKSVIQMWFYKISFYKKVILWFYPPFFNTFPAKSSIFQADKTHWGPNMYEDRTQCTLWTRRSTFFIIEFPFYLFSIIAYLCNL